jgi:hypothetical protein
LSAFERIGQELLAISWSAEAWRGKASHIPGRRERNRPGVFPRGSFSQAVPQSSHALAHASQIVVAIRPCRETVLADTEQNSAQSAQVPSVCRCSLLPELSKPRKMTWQYGPRFGKCKSDSSCFSIALHSGMN